MLPVLASPPWPPLAVALPPVALLEPWSIEALLSWMTPVSPPPPLLTFAPLTADWFAVLVAVAGPPVAVALPPAPPVALPLVAELSPPKLMTCPSGEETLCAAFFGAAWVLEVVAPPPSPAFPVAPPPVPSLEACVVLAPTA